MKKEDLRKAWRTAAIVTGVIISAIFMYALVVEAASRALSLNAPFTGGAAAALKYVLYILGAGAVVSLKFIRPAMETRKDTAAEALAALVKEAVVTAAVCEVPAFAGLMLFFLTGGYADFYLLASISAAAELFFFPKYRVWDEFIRNGCGLTIE